MTKRLLSLLLTGFMMILTLTGCGTNELGYLNLSKEMSNITQYEFTNSTELEISSTAAGEDYNIDLNLEGEANIEDINSMYMNLNVMLKVNDMGNEFPINFVINDNKVYASKNAILEAFKLQEKFDGTTENPKVIDALYNIELKDTEYIMVADLNEYNSVEYKTNYKDMNDSAMTYITTAFKGFDSKLVTKINNGYAITLTPKGTFEFLERLIKYVSDNRELIFDETVKYVENIYDDINIQDLEALTEEEKQASIDELKASRQDFYDLIDEAVLFIESEEYKLYENMFDGSEFKQEVYKKKSSYVQDVEAEMIMADIVMGSLKTTTELTPAEVEIKQITGKSITVDELESLFNKTKNQINPVNKMELSWYPEGYGAEINKYRLDGETEWDYQDYALIDSRVYLPLRYIGESFGEEVAWDDASKKAYVIRGSEKIDMTGVLINNTTMVKVRDFEKLGYKIGFVQADGLSTATIEK